MLIKAVLFDLDNTLYDYEVCHHAGLDAVFEAAHQDYKFSREEFFKRYHDARAAVKKNLPGQAAGHSRLLYFQYFFEQLEGRTLYAESLTANGIYWEGFFEHVVLRPGMLAALQLLKKKGVVCALVSDLNTELQFEKVLHLDLNDYFAFMVTSEEVGADKPDPRSVQKALDKLQIVNSDGVLLVGDSNKCDATVAASFAMPFIKVSSDQESQDLVSTIDRYLRQ